MLGNTLEIYDLVIYGYFASIIAATFFHIKINLLELLTPLIFFSSVIWVVSCVQYSSDAGAIDLAVNQHSGVDLANGNKHLWC